MTPLMAPEAQLRALLPVFVNSCEQLIYQRDTVDCFADNGFRNVTVLDQGFHFPPVYAHRAAPGFLAGHRPWQFGNGLSAQEEMPHPNRASVASTHFGREA